MIIKKHSQEIALYERRLALLEHVDQSFREGLDLASETYDTPDKRVYDAYKDVHSADGVLKGLKKIYKKELKDEETRP